jgi:hypothetical protein
MRRKSCGPRERGFAGKEHDTGLLGNLLAAPVRVLNIPARVVEKLVDPDSERDDEDNILSKPLETLAQAVEEVDGDE